MIRPEHHRSTLLFMPSHKIPAIFHALLIGVVATLASMAVSEDNLPPLMVDHGDFPELISAPTAPGSTSLPFAWTDQRAHLLKLFEEVQYGPLPPKPEHIDVSVEDLHYPTDEPIPFKKVVLTLRQKDATGTMRGYLTLPEQESDKPFPLVIQPRFALPNPDGSFPEPVPPPFARIFTDRGYALLEFDVPDVSPDDNEHYRDGTVHRLFGSAVDDTGSLMAWAWAFHRFVDAAEQLPYLDETKVVVTGHSRYGKACLIAGAFDERIAITAPSHSGTAGVAPYRKIYGNAEQLHNIAGFAPHWFRPGFADYSDRVSELPIDQHQLLALIAPRALLTTEGTLDHWTNPRGAQQTWVLASRVFRILSAEDRIATRVRPTGHIPDFHDLVDFCDAIFFDKELPDGFNKLAYPIN